MTRHGKCMALLGGSLILLAACGAVAGAAYAVATNALPTLAGAVLGSLASVNLAGITMLSVIKTKDIISSLVSSKSQQQRTV